MQTPGRAYENFGQSMRPHASFNPDYATSSKQSAGKSFTIDALLARPDHLERDRTSVYRTITNQAPASSSAVPLAAHMYSQIPHFAYSQNIMHTQSGYPVFCYPPYSYQTCRGAMYSQGMCV